jgi:predicted ATPase
VRRSREALALARELSHPFSEAFALVLAAPIHRLCGRWKTALEGAEAAIDLSNAHGFLQWSAIGAFERAAALAKLGRLAEGIAGMRAFVEALRSTGRELNLPLLLALLAEAHQEGGQAEEGLALLAEAQERVTKTGERAYEAEVRRLKGDLLLALPTPDPAEAEAAYLGALEVARRQGAKSWELRAATSLARLWKQQGRREEARSLLAPVFDWFTEGFDTRDLRQAQALLDELA